MNTDVTKFVDEILPGDGSGIIYAHRTDPKGMAHFGTLHGLSKRTDCYWSVAIFPHSGVKRTKAQALGVRALVIDDVETKVSGLAVEMALGMPTAIVETSTNNYQWVYRLSKPVPVAEWDRFFAEVERRVGMPLDGKDAVHLFRLPMGVNTRKGGFMVRLEALNPGQTLDPATIMAKAPAIAPAAPWTAGAADKIGLNELRELMEKVPNTFDDRDTWIEIGHGIKALCANDADGFEVFNHWSLQHPSYDEDETRRVWDSFGVSGLRSKGGMLKDRAEKSRAFAQEAFDDGSEHPKRKGITLTDYDWTDPDKIPPRDWLYGDILLRRFLSMTVAPGGVGKSSLIAAETLAQVTGRNLLGVKPSGKLKVWLWNLEDPLEETQRKIQAAALHYGISEADIGDRLFVDSGRNQQLIIARMDRNGPTVVQHVMDDLIAEIKRLRIDVVVIDPFVSCHEVPENDNTAQDMVVKAWSKVAELGNCAVHLIDHTRKGLPGTEVTSESSRGGKAKVDAARIVRVINRMTKAEGAAAVVTNEWRYFRTFNDKANMAPPADNSTWFYMESIGLGNGSTAAAAFGAGVGAAVVPGDSVGVATSWAWPSAAILGTGDSFKKVVVEMGNDEWRKDPQAKPKWIGVAVARALNLDPAAPKDRKYINGVLSKWYEMGLLKVVSQKDENRKLRDFIQVAGGTEQFATPATPCDTY